MLFAVLALALAFVAVSGSPAHAAADPVGMAIKTAERRGQISAAERRYYMREWRHSARVMNRLDRTGQQSRAIEIANVRRITTRLAARRQLHGERLPAVMANVKVTTWVFGKRPFPAQHERIQVPFDEAVFAYYRGSGMQFQPLFTFTHANTLYLTHQDERLRRLMVRMDELSVPRGGFRTWEYYFPYGGGEPPWVSGMAQGVAVQVLARTWERTKEARFRKLGRQALEGFSRTPRRGGFAVYEGAGRWYLLYGFNGRQRILNGHLQALIGLNDYYRITGDDLARVRLNQGIASVVPMLKRFDTGAWSRYQLGQEADINYHDLQTSQLSKLGNRTAITQFADMSHRFATYRSTPPRIDVPEQRMAPFYPSPVDGLRDRFSFRFFLDKRATVQVRIVTRTGAAVRTMRITGGRGMHTITWDGRTTQGRFAPRGAYVLQFTATDVIGNRRHGQVSRLIEVRRDTTAPEIRAVEVTPRGSSTVVSVSVKDSESPYVDASVRRAGKVLAAKRGAGRITLVVRRPASAVRRGTLRLADSSGNVTMLKLAGR